MTGPCVGPGRFLDFELSLVMQDSWRAPHDHEPLLSDFHRTFKNVVRSRAQIVGVDGRVHAYRGGGGQPPRCHRVPQRHNDIGA